MGRYFDFDFNNPQHRKYVGFSLTFIFVLVAFLILRSYRSQTLPVPAASPTPSKPPTEPPKGQLVLNIDAEKILEIYNLHGAFAKLFHVDSDGFECGDLIAPSGSSNLSCPGLTEETFRDINGSMETRHCCHIKWNKNFEHKCRLAPCASSASPCTTFLPRFINNGSTQLEYEEIFALPCNSPRGDERHPALCCVTGSPESHLASTLGAEFEEFPIMVKIRFDGRECAGTVYNRKFVITASHCLSIKKTEWVTTKPTVEEMQVIHRSNYMKSDIYNVSKVIPHPKKSYIDGRHFGHFLLNDISLVELATELQGNVKALEIPPKNFNPLAYASDTLLVGWGSSIYTEDDSEPYAFLHKTHLSIESDEECFENQNLQDFKGLKDQFICLKGAADRAWNPTITNLIFRDNRDDGGAAICRGPNETALFCGVASIAGQSEECQENCIPTLYAAVSYYSDWIIETAGVQDPQTFYKPNLFGKVVPKGKFPHQVHITSTAGKTCGGTLIAPDIVLTAAQCVGDDSGISYNDLRVTAWVDDSTKSGTSYGVAGLATFPGFERIGHPVDIHNQGDRVMFTDNLFVNDIAMLRLNGDSNISPNQLPAISMELNPEQATEFAFTRGTNESNRQEMRTREFRFLTHAQCQSRIDRLPMAVEDMVYFDEKLLCGIEVFSGGSICDRELGGGVICQGASGRSNLCGIQVFRLCEYSAPSIFIDIAMYAKWIKDTMAKLQKLL